MKNEKMKKILTYLVLITMAFFVLTSCADVIPIEECVVSVETVGFWSGLWHGLVSPFSFIGSLFDKDIAMYAVNNNGGWYDFGFILGVAIIFGGGSKSSTKL